MIGFVSEVMRKFDVSIIALRAYAAPVSRWHHVQWPLRGVKTSVITIAGFEGFDVVVLFERYIYADAAGCACKH